MAKDKRTKCCPNEICENGRNRKKNKYGADSQYCDACGSELVLVCSKCLGPIADEGPKHKICATCEAKTADRNDKIKKIGGRIVVGAGALGTAAVAFVRNGGAKKAANIVFKIIGK